ncbi:hypothetical protein KM927_27980 [Priestia megaterium]|uniref:ImmA/IrrE family metallo-endopeptidase n=1 Tax=Priestia megaterium TaxID=1404 RepID=UPI001C226EA3|nr:hypothetical protein [Priestia megaterium]MBU8757312.1 hypothetical protein [Priestia megaterium]
MRITSDILEQTIVRNKEIKREIEGIINCIDIRYKTVRILSPEKQALQILKEHHLIQLPILDDDWGGAIRKLPNGKKVFVINTAQPRVYQYFIYWHEIYHLIADFEESSLHLISTEFDLRERKADYFASQMLLGSDVYEYYFKLDKTLGFIQKIMHCMDMFKAPYKAVLIQLYESAKEKENKDLMQDIKNNFDIKLDQVMLESLFKELALDVTLVQPSDIIDFGDLKVRIDEKRQSDESVEMYKDHQEFINHFKKRLEGFKSE